MEFIRPDINIAFIPNAKKFLTASAIVVGICWLLTLVLGLNYGIDFAGGTEIQVRFNKAVSANEVRDAMNKLQGMSAEVQSFGLMEDNEYLIKLSSISFVNEKREKDIEEGLKAAFNDKGLKNFHHSTAGGDKVEFILNSRVDDAQIKGIFAKADAPTDEITVTGSEGRYIYRCVLAGLTPHVSEVLSQGIGPDTFEILRLDSVGPKVGDQLKQKGILAILYALIGILIYIAFRFNMQFAPGAVVALIHDISITVGIFALFRIEFTIPTIAALLTIVGYSLNDTIVVYDRIRENLSKTKVKTLSQVVNESINQTLSRTILTSTTTLFVVAALILFGGGIIFDFALALLIGVLVGTYSSVFVAAPVMIYITNYLDKRANA